MTKLLFGIFLSIFLSMASPAQGARVVPGSVPSLAPLEPFPQADVSPNYKNNINSPQEPIQTSPGGGEPKTNVPADAAPPPPSPASGVTPKTTAKTWWFTASILIAAIIYLIVQRRPRR